jgi:hypothetical protein
VLEIERDNVWLTQHYKKNGISDAAQANQIQNDDINIEMLPKESPCSRKPFNSVPPLLCARIEH